MISIYLKLIIIIMQCFFDCGYTRYISKDYVKYEYYLIINI